jgi:hypothetical protein
MFLHFKFSGVFGADGLVKIRYMNILSAVATDNGIMFYFYLLITL